MIELENKVILVSKQYINDKGEESFDTFFATLRSCDSNTVVVI